ncbi:elsinochrome C biosynthesis regulatory protein elcR-like protein [Parastagonospora nodorum]|nr:elsinochrome C biosynthesis regulatory protein elcR-like protein [Parastagonospora nodorum]KAH4253201.1 elsinochrome C biosynthesis regulatory protein elcR-like protein [Parastagonospora nodorum]KAH4277680.1 elsinochrome C biosynthesis regulatory protein elcR-like protein [Parastagonospora nodorum]KAH4600560.1 elsinochrome C biosynthesis regulatory protein elcR-like protein [Parastagonospora nodorum]KAH4672170.1 elsinochrome C biosynthesis regulatory protein elcR-like protein [Parastagonospo
MATQLPSPTATTSHSGNEPRRVIRESCNNCSAQKIRCGKQRPACARCVNKKLQCNYSYSQRSGRRSSSMNTQRDGPHIAFLPGIPDTPATMPDANAMSAMYGSLTTSSPGLQGTTLSPSIETSLEYDQNPFEDPNQYHDLTFDFLASPPNTEPLHSRSTSSNTGTDMGDTAMVDSEAFWHSFPSMPPQNLDALRSVSNHPIFDQDQVASFRRSLEKTVQHGHDCMALALQVVNDLSVTREPCLVATSNPMTGIETHQMHARDVDTVLFINRDAAQSVKKILDCSCSSDQAVSLACYLATSKIVDWYGAAIEAVGERTEDFSKNAGPKTSQGIMAERIIARPIYMGKYCLDPEVQRVVRAQVVLGELKEHVQPLLNSLPRFHITGLEAESDSSANGQQACILRNQLRNVIQSARDLNGTGSS